MQAPVQLGIENSELTNNVAAAAKADNNVDESKDHESTGCQVDNNKHHNCAIGVHQTHHFTVNVGCKIKNKNSVKKKTESIILGVLDLLDCDLLV